MKDALCGLVFACVAFVVYACSADLPADESAQPDAGVYFSDVGKSCATSADCSGGACIDVVVLGGAIEKRCSAPCARTFDCIPGWLCSDPGSGEPSMCSCSGTKETCDGLDNDCNGVVDDDKPATESCTAAGGGLCVNGKCTCEHRCSGECVDFATDARHCGACNAACPPGSACVDSACVCGPRLADAGAPSAVDGGDAGASPPVSSPEMRLCHNACVDVSSDVLRCGGCGKVCAPNEACADSKCVCKGRQCGGRCVDTTSDLSNCGSCGSACDYSCRAGACGVETIALQQSGIADFAVAGSKIYWTRNGRLLACEKHGCTSPTLLNTFRAATDLALTSDKIYLQLDEYKANEEPKFDQWFTGIGFCPIGGCPGTPNGYTVAPRLTATGDTIDRGVSSFAATADRLYFTSCAGAGSCRGSRFVRVCDRTNDCAGGPSTLAEDAATDVDRFEIDAVDDARILWSVSTYAGSYAIRSCTLPDCAGGPLTITSGEGELRDVTRAGNMLFLALRTSGNNARTGIAFCPVSGCSAPTMMVDANLVGPSNSRPGNSPSVVAASSERVYWGRDADTNGGGLYSCPLAPGGGCSGPVTVVESNQGLVRRIAVDEASVYWIDGSQSIKRFSHRLQ